MTKPVNEKVRKSSLSWHIPSSILHIVVGQASTIEEGSMRVPDSSEEKYVIFSPELPPHPTTTARIDVSIPYTATLQPFLKDTHIDNTLRIRRRTAPKHAHSYERIPS